MSSESQEILLLEKGVIYLLARSGSSREAEGERDRGTCVNPGTSRECLVGRKRWEQRSDRELQEARQRREALGAGAGPEEQSSKNPFACRGPRDPSSARQLLDRRARSREQALPPPRSSRLEGCAHQGRSYGGSVRRSWADGVTVHRLS